jgi:hypothetical protein
MATYIAIVYDHEIVHDYLQQANTTHVVEVVNVAPIVGVFGF